MASLPASSREYVYAPVGAEALGLPTEIAIVAEDAGEPADSDYRQASWEGGEVRILVGPGGGDIVLAAGVYVVWVRVTAGDEKPVRRSGLLTVGPL